MQTCTIWAQRLLLLLTVTCVAMLAQLADQSRGYTNVTATANTDNLPFVVLNIPPGPLMLRGVTLKKLIMDAYGMPGFLVTDGPSWVKTERWDFRLQAVPPIMSTEQHRQVLLRSLEIVFN